MKILHTTGLYVITALVSVLCAFLVLDLWAVSFHVPFCYHWDGLTAGSGIKGLLENGWYLVNDKLGAPNGYFGYDYPSFDTLHFLLLKVLAFCSNDFAMVMNLFYLLTFPLTAITSLYVFNRLGSHWTLSAAFALLFTCLHYHFARGELHLFLSAYYLIPLIGLLALENCSPAEQSTTRLGMHHPARDLALCLLIAMSGIYYAFFSVYFISVSGCIRCLRGRSIRHFLPAVILSSVVVAVLFFQYLPTFFYQRDNGPNTQAFVRDPGESEQYGLKLTSLLLPVTSHRISALADLKKRYNETTTLKWRPESDTATLGLLGSLGFLLLLLWPFVRFTVTRGSTEPRLQILDDLSLLTLAGLLFGTIAGLGTMFSLLVTSEIRSVARISVFLAFFAIAGSLLFLDWLRQAVFDSSMNRRLGFQAVLLSLATLALFEQTATSSAYLQPDQLRRLYQADRQFTQTIEKSAPEGAMILQLPYSNFPEPHGGRIPFYDHLRLYLHSRSLRYSHGGMTGRPGDEEIKRISSLPLEQLLPSACAMGYRGIFLNAKGYQQNVDEMIKAINGFVQSAPIVHPDNVHVYFDIGNFCEKRISLKQPS